MNVQTKPPRPPLNGVDTQTLLNTINFVAGQPDLARFQFRAANRWIEGTHSRSAMLDFSGAGGEHKHLKSYFGDSDHPAVLCGGDRAPTPVEWLLHALASCITAEQRLQARAARHGLEAMTSAMRATKERSERLMRAAIAEVPDGVYRFANLADDDGTGFEAPTGDVAEPGTSEGGLGIAIIRTLSDECEIAQREGGGSRLRFMKLLSA